MNEYPYSPLRSLLEGHWFKLICGASYQDLPTIRDLALVYTLAGADCIDVAADRAVIEAAREGIESAAKIPGFARKTRPWLMVSLNDGEDPHFRKALFDPNLCPIDCSRPCERICPANAIDASGVIDRRCYGCGRCLPVCPLGLIETRSRIVEPGEIVPILLETDIDAIEIHTSVGHEESFRRLWEAIAPATENLKILAISCQDHENLFDYLRYIRETIGKLSCPLIWQTDGRPMSGDIGKGTTHPAIAMARKVLSSDFGGFVQLAGGTNAHTVTKLEQMGLLGKIAGIAYGSYARSIVLPILDRIPTATLENHPESLREATGIAIDLVSGLKDRAVTR
ncbi:LdpA C-terminal domain-containing domain [Pannus brasiliensis CCIBt3594]|uniref:LdpA C-terminal domain-containing domain n=1 Tax=Pannus brasiliensis CCIBt3594 TaxID=1427578 RepID=A0AAW9QG17_9CHRO